MATKVKLIPDEYETFRNRSPGKCVKSTLTRILAISVIFFIILMMSIIYHGIVLERMDQLRQIVAFNVRHGHNKNPTDNDLQLTANLKLLSDESTDTYSDEQGIRGVKHSRMKYRRHRIRRELPDLLDPLFKMQREPDFKGLYAKIRNKREQIALNKLEEEYKRCKKQSGHGNDCMVAFVRMYHLAKDISEKMEKMKEIFKDSELVLQKSSSSDLNESIETPTSGNQTLEEVEILVEDKIDTIALTTEGFESTTIANTTTAKPTKAVKHKPVKISWIIDGNDDFEDSEESTEATSTTSTTSKSLPQPAIVEQLITTEAVTATKAVPTTETVDNMTTDKSVKEKHEKISWILDGSESVDVTTNESGIASSNKTSKFEKISWILDGHDHEDEAIRTTTARSMSLKDDLITESPHNGTESPHNGTESHRDIIKELESATDNIENDEEKLRKLKIDWIVDGEDASDEKNEHTNDTINSTTITPITATDNVTNLPSTAFPTKPKPIKYSWIIDSDANSGETTASTVDSKKVSTTTLPSSFKMLHELVKFVNNTPITIRYGGNCTQLNQSNDNGCKAADVPPTSTPSYDKMAINDTNFVTVHPLDYPDSIENMLDSFERHEGLKPITHDYKESNKNKTTSAGVYDAKEWEKKFKETAAHHSKEELIDTFGDLDAKSSKKFGPKLNPVNLNGLQSNAQLMTLCERIAKRLRNKDGGNNQPELFTQAPGIQFTSRGPAVGFPVTGETMKTSAQFMLNSNFGLPTIPICFYATPASFRVVNPAAMWTPSSYGMPIGGGNGGYGAFGGGMTPMASAGGPGGGNMFFVPQGNFGSTGNFFGHASGTAGGGSGNNPNTFTKSASPQQYYLQQMQQLQQLQQLQQQQQSQQQQKSQQQQQRQFFCTYMQNQSSNQANQRNNFAGLRGMNDFSNADFKSRTANHTAATDIIYASYAGLPELMGDKEDQFKCLLSDQTACYGGDECVSTDSWCDGTVDCSDGSDEAACRCRDRLLSERICDGYADCPMKEDEIGCFGCDNFMYSCYETPEDYEHFNRSTVSMCYSAVERCDGFKNCLNGRDELECSILVRDTMHHMSHSVSTSEGFLYRNNRGDWYPVCNNADKWAREACENEIDELIGLPNVTFRAHALSGPFIEPSLIGNVNFSQSCQQRDSADKLVDVVAFVNCAPPKCGIRKGKFALNRRLKSKRLAKKQRQRMRRELSADSAGRIVGGSYSKPLQWPFVVAIYRNGNFHCGGTIFSENWIISAAHCAINYHKYHYEVRAGVLRRSSYAVSSQIRLVSHVVVHQKYERRTMRNDLSLMRLSEPLQFNRWVKPICLPDEGRTTAGSDWIWGPEENALCTVVGWGAIREKGPGSDQLREVVVPIRKGCIEKEDREAEDICAGDADGGRDACQGDSGGPLFCRSVNNSAEVYLAGVVSHGNGCARPGEFGVYTRVALYLDWIAMAVRSEFLPDLQPQQICPGYICVWGGSRCIPQRHRCDRIVHCLGGEDEVGCIYKRIPDMVGAGSQNITTTTESDYHPEKPAATTKTRIQLHKNDGGNTDLDYDVILGATGTTTDLIATDKSETAEEATTKEITTTPQVTLREEVVENVNIDSSTNIPPDMPTQAPKPFEVESLITTTLKPPEILTTVTDSTTIMVSSTHFPSSTEDLQKLQDLAKKALAHKSTQSNPIESTTAGISSVTTEGTTFATKLATVDGELTTEPTTTDTATDSTSLTTTITTEATEPNKSSFNTTKIPQKFVCQKIPQIIEESHRCDRIVDCEDGTDEEGCSCRDLLKGSLKTLVCDGKTDCEDLTDEKDCGYCKSDEFRCPLSKTCLPLRRRCDNIIDCTFKEDESDCFALTNGKVIFMDSNKQPVLKNMGIFTRNRNGVWRVVCTHETFFHKHGAQTAAEVCSLLGFNGITFYNSTVVTKHDLHMPPIDPHIEKRPRLKAPHFSPIVGDNLHFSSAELIFPVPIKMKDGSLRLEKTGEMCLGIYVECNAKSNKTLPLKTLSAGMEIPPPSMATHKLKPLLKTHSRPNVYVKPQVPALVLTKKDEIMNKLSEVIESKKNATVMVHNKLHEAVEELHWPWLSDIYVNGRLWCVGTLVDKHWVMVHESCYFGVRLHTNFVAALFGGGKTKHIPHKSLQEQIRRVDCFELVPNSDVILYHLERPVHFTHYILPAFLPDTATHNAESSRTSQQCLAILHDDKYGRIKTVSVKEVKDDKLCQSADVSCYQLVANRPPQNLMSETELSAEDLASVSEEIELKDGEDHSEFRPLSRFTTCAQFGIKNTTAAFEPIDQGILMCREQNSGWYPTAMFAYNNTDCSSFKEPFGIRTLEKVYKRVQNIIDHPKCVFKHAAATCSTLRCPLGNCLEYEQICNNHNDCHDGSDEDADMCRKHKKECKASEMKCRTSHKCIPKTKFCDHVPDCEDLSDEPTICSCLTYLQATDPSKICDGIRNCWDKSDESPAFCNCTAEHFQCGAAATECVPQDFVCDKEFDCPNGEDEKFCYGIEHPINHKDIWKTKKDRPPLYGQVIEQTYGIWHTKCFPRDSPPDTNEMRQICKKLGYNPYRLPTYRLIDDVANEVVETNEQTDQRGRSFSNDTLIGKYRDSTKALVSSKFSPLHLNEVLTIFLKPSRPIAELVRWNATDSSKCFRMEIRCA